MHKPIAILPCLLGTQPPAGGATATAANAGALDFLLKQPPGRSPWTAASVAAGSELCNPPWTACNLAYLFGDSHLCCLSCSRGDLDNVPLCLLGPALGQFQGLRMMVQSNPGMLQVSLDILHNTALIRSMWLGGGGHDEGGGPVAWPLACSRRCCTKACSNT